MTSITASEGDSSWLKKRTTVFNNITPSTAATSNKSNNNVNTNKVVDKELARLKNMGAVSSVWSNKFVQEDNPGGNRQSFNATSSPNSPNLKAHRTLSNSSKELANNVTAALQENTRPVIKNRLTNGSVSSIDLNDDSIATRRPSSTLVDDTVQVKRPPSTDDTSLWSQCESLKSQYTEVNSRLTQANQDIAFYKQQLESMGASMDENLKSATEERDKEVSRVRQLAELIVKQHELLGEYEISLERLSQSTSEVQSEKTQCEIEALRQELTGLYKMKNEMEKTIASLKADLEMSYSQMRLMMVVSTEIQSEFESYKKKVNAEINELLAEKQQEYEQSTVIEYGIATSSPDSFQELEALRLEIKKLNAAIEERDRQSKAVLEEHENTLSVVREQEVELQKLKTELLGNATSSYRNSGGNTVKFLQNQIAELNRTLEQKDKIINKLESQMKTQRMNMDSQMIDLTQTILEKDALLLEFMSSRNNSTDSNIICSSPTMADPPKTENNDDATGRFYQRQNEAKRQMSQVRDFMYTTSSDEEQGEDLEAAYSTDEEATHPIQPIHHFSDKTVSSISHGERSPQSPAGTVSSYISFESSDEEEEQVAEIKHFSYTSVLSQSTLSLHSNNSTVINTTQNERTENQRNSGSLFTKDSSGSTSWPMPPPTPPPSEPLPPLPVFSEEKRSAREDVSTPPPPRRGRSKTMVREELPSPYTTSIHKTNGLPRIVPLQKDPIDTLPVPPPRKDVKRPVIDSLGQTQANHRLPANTTWMDDPESEEEEHWSEALSH